MTTDQAAAYRAAYFRPYPRLAVCQPRQGGGYEAIDTRTRGSRRRLGVTRYTEKLNSPIQGTAADGLKAALALLWDRRHEHPTAFAVLVARDEILIECDATEAEGVKAWLVAAMIDGMTPFRAPVPVVVGTRVGATWAAGGDQG